VDLRFYLLVIGVLGVWRVTHLLQAEDGPWDFVVRLRGYAGTGMWGRLMDCFYCLSLWIAPPFALLCGEGWTERLLLWPALSAGAILIERVNGGLLPQPRFPSIDEGAPQSDLQTYEKKES
jgi:hypothetical protein